ncbi:MAG: shikimate dehydrogenase [Clostridia bacterium]|nr:shikimate dehydrogenase [Clostridia bacterium]
MEYGLIGEKLGHSFSKVIHSEIADYNYELMEIPKNELESFMKNPQFKAINVTIPYKQDVIPFLDVIDEAAEKIGAVNTIVNKDGKLYGYNTDFLGLKALIERENIELKSKKVLILGSGGTSKTAFAVAEAMGAEEVYRVSRKGGNGLITYKEAESIHNDADVIINTTPCGMYPNNDGAAIDISGFEKLSGVVDVVYNPLNTELVLKARESGIKATGGLYMLVAQAVFAAEKFIDKSIDKSQIDRIYNKLFKAKQNIVLIGMPSSGKTTIGKMIADELSLEFFDSDEEIVKKEGRAIREIFETDGEKYFRELESKEISELSKKQSALISTGGGAILNKRNVDKLRQNGFIVFIDRPIELLVSTDDRPLSSNREQLIKRYNERYEIYCSSADFIVKNDCETQTVIKKIKEAFLNENSGA